MRSISAEIENNILAHCAPATLTIYAQASRATVQLARHYLYRRLTLSFARAPLLFRSLATTPELGGLVRLFVSLTPAANDLPQVQNLTLHRGPSPESKHEGRAFERALASLTKLLVLKLHCPIDGSTLSSHLRAPLVRFSWDFPVSDDIYDFLHARPTVLSIRLARTMNRRPPRTWLPSLTVVYCRPWDLPTVLQGRPVVHLVLIYRPGDFFYIPRHDLRFLNYSTKHIRHLECQACQLFDAEEDVFQYDLPRLRRLVITQDYMWGRSAASVSGKYFQ